MTDHEGLTLLFYLLMRDDLPSGRVEQRVQDVEAAMPTGVEYSCEYLEAKAKEMATRILYPLKEDS